MNVLLTGASGTLGKPLVDALRAGGATVTALSRRDHDDADGVRWVRGDLRTGEGLAGALERANVVVHAATDGGAAEGKVRLRYMFFHPRRTDVEGTQLLVESARANAVTHFVYVSIVGIDRVPYEYYRIKLDAERIVSSASIPYTIARVTQFHTYIDSLFRFAMRSPFPMTGRSLQVQPIDPGDAARSIAGVVDGPPAAGIVEIGGPEVLNAGEAADEWLVARGSRRRFRSMPVAGRTFRAVADGGLLTKDRSGTITWKEWVHSRYGGKT